MIFKIKKENGIKSIYLKFKKSLSSFEKMPVSLNMEYITTKTTVVIIASNMLNGSWVMKKITKNL